MFILNMVAVGDTVPSSELLEGALLKRVNINDICRGKKIILFGVCGAFTPGCSKTHLPGYIARSNELKKIGISEIICVTVNDVFVAEAWARDQGAEGKVRVLADPDANFTKSLGLEMDIPQLGGIRSKRYSMLIEDNVVMNFHLEPDGIGLTCSLVQKILT